MSGHSKWSTIKHKKAAKDVRRGKLFTKLIREITVATRMGGSGDLNFNPRLRLAVGSARAASMPNENIDRAIKKGAGEGTGEIFEEVTYEGYGPGGVAILVHVLTDNRNRTVADVRNAFAKNGGNLGETGCVNYLFQHRGVILVEREAVDEERLIELALAAGADDISESPEGFAITTDPEALHAVQQALEAAAIVMASAELTHVPMTSMPVAPTHVAQLNRLVELLEDSDDVQSVVSNADLVEEAAASHAVS